MKCRGTRCDEKVCSLLGRDLFILRFCKNILPTWLSKASSPLISANSPVCCLWCISHCFYCFCNSYFPHDMGTLGVSENNGALQDSWWAEFKGGPLKPWNSENYLFLHFLCSGPPASSRRKEVTLVMTKPLTKSLASRRPNQSLRMRLSVSQKLPQEENRPDTWE